MFFIDWIFEKILSYLYNFCLKYFFLDFVAASQVVSEAIGASCYCYYHY